MTGHEISDFAFGLMLLRPYTALEEDSVFFEAGYMYVVAVPSRLDAMPDIERIALLAAGWRDSENVWAYTQDRK